MANPLRALARRVLGVTRTSTYYLPWLTRPGLECTLVLHNVEARLKPGYNEGPFAVSVTQHDADGRVVRLYEAALRDSTDHVELRLEPTAAGCGFVTVAGERLRSQHFVTLSDGHDYTGTHGRGEFVERYPVWTRALMAALGEALARFGRTIPAFARDQYVYLGPDSRSHLLLMNLSNVTNRIRIAAHRDGARLGSRLVALPPMGSRLVDVTTLGPVPERGTEAWRLRLEGNAWFNLYLVGAGPRDLAGPLSLMHVK
jgi:hypothetical protein